MDGQPQRWLKTHRKRVRASFYPNITVGYEPKPAMMRRRRQQQDLVREGETADQALDRMIREHGSSRRARSENLGERRDLRRMTAGGEPAGREPEVWTLPPGLHRGDEPGAGGAGDRGPPLPPGEMGMERPGQHPGEGQARGSRDGQGPGQQEGQVRGQATHHRLDENDGDGTGILDPRRYQEPRGDPGFPGGHDQAFRGGHGRGFPGGHDQADHGGNGRGFPGGHDQADHGGNGRGFPGGHDQADHGGHGRGFPGGHDQADHGGHRRGFPGGHDQAGHGGKGHGFSGGHDQGARGGNGSGPPGGHDQGIRRSSEPGLLGGLMEVRPRQLEPYANWTPQNDPYGRNGGGTPGPGAVNPFWSPEVQQRVALGRVPPGGASSQECREPGSGGDREVEDLRKRVFREAEETFEREVMRLQAARAGDDVSYKTASDGGATGGPVPPPHPEVVRNLAHGWATEDRPPPPPPPPPPRPTEGGGEAATAFRLSEALRNLELPSLPPPGGEGSSLQFGDWVTVITPLMSDIAGSARLWWEQVLQKAELTYAEWLTATPLEKLRLKPTLGDVEAHNHRVEQRGLSMLLAALPDPIRREIISARMMSATEIMFRLHQVYQPGGTSERGNLLKHLTDPKVGANLCDALQTLRLWRRWLARAEELDVALPDGLVLITVLGKIAEVVGKTGAQASFRISSVRQELQIDIRPQIGKIKQFAEYLQAEAEELSLTTAIKAASTPGATGTGPATSSLKALAAAGATEATPEVTDNRKKPQGPACRFWGTDGGCKKGSSCTYAHSWEGLEKTNRCFACSGMGHSKRDCPVKKSTTVSPWKQPAPKVSKVKKPGDEKAPIEGQAAGGEGARLSGSPGSAEEASQEATGWNPGTASSAPRSTGEPARPPPGGSEEASGLLTEVAGLLKSLRSIRALQIKYAAAGKEAGRSEEKEQVALLDGGATHALRQARRNERDNLTAVEVELACGSTVLYKHAGTSAILTLEPVEPIIPLRMLVDAGFVVRWNAKGCSIEHPGHGKLHCWLRYGCPVMRRAEAMKLMDFLDAPEKAATGTMDEERWQRWFPSIPDEVLKLMGRVEGEAEVAARCPFNRRLRRKWETSKGVVVHLFAGRDAKEWRKEDWGGYEVVTVDIEEDVRQNLHDGALWGYLWSLAEKGLIKAVVGGPPCRTVSRLRHHQPGPPPLRGRDVCRFGLPGLSEEDRKKVNGDTALFFKQMGLWLRAQECSEEKRGPVGFLLESPMDPVEYDPRAVELDVPSFWNFQEVQDFCQENMMDLVSFDQGAAGHPRRKPTTLATNLPGMGELHGMKGQGHQEMEGDLRKRLVQTKTWAKWAPGLVAAIKMSLKELVKRLEERKEEKAMEAGELKKMTLEKWKQHVGRGHTPFNRRCRICMQEAGVDRQHRRLKADIPSYVLNVDIAGPFSTGEDVGTSRKVKYVLIGTVPIPIGAGDKEPSETAEPEEEDPNPADWEEEENQPRVSDEEAKRLNDKVKDEML